MSSVFLSSVLFTSFLSTLYEKEVQNHNSFHLLFMYNTSPTTKITMDPKSKAQQEEAAAELEAYFNKTRPRNLAEGVTTGLGSVVSGAFGTVGAIVLTPIVATHQGYTKAGFIGGALGLTIGLVGGVVGGVVSAAGGLFKGVTQIGRGVVAVPYSIAGPMHGKWWNDIDGKWVKTDLEKEEIAMSIVPNDDIDILGEKANEKANEKAETGTDKGDDPLVKDPYYYDILGVSTGVDQVKMKRQYYLLARKYHPDKVGDDEEASEKFKDISEAYQVLADPELRHIYDQKGMDGLAADKAGAAQKDQLDPTILFAFLFGSDQFNDYVGRLAVATSALAGDLTLKEARKLQIRRCTRIAIKICKRLEHWVHPDIDNEFSINKWKDEANTLSQASYGHELVVLIGNVYSLAATQFLGSLDSGVGMPSITKWAKAKIANMEKKNAKTKATMDTIQAAISTMKKEQEAKDAIAHARTETERKAIEEENAKSQLSMMLKVMWTMTTVDITSTLYEAVQMTLYDKSVDKATLKKRAKGLLKLGETFSACPSVEKDNDPGKIYEEAAFAAMLETVKRKEDQSFRASFGGA